MITGYEKAPIPDNSVDIAISNVPFGPYGVTDPEYRNEKFVTDRIHNYYFAKTMDKLRPGGVMAFVTTHNTLDAQRAKAIREWLAQRCDLAGAVRLPSDAFPDTEVITDIIYMRKRQPGEPAGDDSWVETQPIELPTSAGREATYNINSYYADNPSAVLGRNNAEGSMYGPGEYSVASEDDRPLAQVLPAAVARVSAAPPRISPVAAPMPRVSAEARVSTSRPEGQYFIDEDGSLKVVKRDYQKTEVGKTKKGKPIYEHLPITGSYVDTPVFRYKGGEDRVRSMMAIRDDARRLLDLESADAPTEEITELRDTLKAKYTEFVKKHGNLNAQQNQALMRADPDSAFLRALERPHCDQWYGADVFSKRVVGGVPFAFRGYPMVPEDRYLLKANGTPLLKRLRPRPLPGLRRAPPPTGNNRPNDSHTSQDPEIE